MTQKYLYLSITIFFFRIQSDSLPAVSAILEVFIAKLNFYGKKNDFRKKMKLTASTQLPTPNLLGLVDNHMAAHTKLEEIRVNSISFMSNSSQDFCSFFRLNYNKAQCECVYLNVVSS